MVDRIEDMPPGTVGFRIGGRITPEDYANVLVPALHEVVDAGEQLRTLFLIEHLDEIEAGAMWADSKLGFDLAVRHHGAWERSAIVSDVEWIVRSMHFFAWMVPGETRVYPMAELEPAKAWVAALPHG
jgi:hypothetical protein